jgi:hypothetical protein
MIIQQFEKFYKDIQNDEHHRYKSWEHCFDYFRHDKDKIEIDKATLHLAFYLSSWGMYRGSSYLLQKDYLINKDLIEHVLLDEKYLPLQIIDYKNIREKLELVFELKNDICKYYPQKIKYIDGKEKDIKVSDTLVTKIILGTLGCTPAYDRFFIQGLKIQGLKNYSFNKKSYREIIGFYLNHSDEIDTLSKQYNQPIMKIIDIYFWSLGFEKFEKERINKK